MTQALVSNGFVPEKKSVNSALPMPVYEVIAPYRDGLGYHEKAMVTAAAILAFAELSPERRQCLVREAIRAEYLPEGDWKDLVERAKKGQLCDGDVQQMAGMLVQDHTPDDQVMSPEDRTDKRARRKSGGSSSSTSKS